MENITCRPKGGLKVAPKRCGHYLQRQLRQLSSGPRGGLRGSIDPPRILEDTLRVRFGVLTPLCVIPSVLTRLSEIPNEASVLWIWSHENFAQICSNMLKLDSYP